MNPTLRKTFLFVFLLFPIAFNCVAQSYTYKNRKFDWGDQKPVAIKIEPQFADEDAVILEEETELSLIRNNIGKMFNDNRIEKHLRIKFLTTKGIEQFSNFILPEPLDPAAEYQNLEIWKRDSVHRPKANFDVLEYFAARIIKPDGSIIAPEIDYKMNSEPYYNKYINEMKFSSLSAISPWSNYHNAGTTIEMKFYDYQFKIKSLKVNDEIEIYYSISDVFTTARFFFNANFPIQKLDFTFKHLRNATYILECFNGANPNDTIIDNNIRKYVWHFANLKGCMNEAGAHLYSDLPNVAYYHHLRDYGKLNAAGNDIDEALPYPWGFALEGLVGYNMKHDTLYDKGNLAVRKLFKNYALTGDTDAIRTFAPIHNLITDSFRYQSDYAFRTGNDTRGERLDEFINGRTLREVSRDTLYDKLIYLLNKNYYYVYPQDKRVDDIQFEHFTYFDYSNPMFCILSGNNANYFTPKQHRFGMYINEFPFYYEGANVVLVPQREKEDEYYKKFKNITFLFSKMPFSSVRDNLRNTTVMTVVSLDSLNISFDARIKLSGQFSTMQRGYYQYAYYDSTVNMQYFKGVNDNLKGMKLISKEMVSCDKEFPFAAELRFKYNSDKIIEKEKDGIYEIDIAQWFKHIYLSKFNASKRATSFYPDFVFFDEYKYYIKFDKAVELVDTLPFNFEVENDLGVYKIKSTQVQPDVILLQSDFIINQSNVPFDKTKSVEVIYNFIEQIDKQKMKIKVM